MPHPIAPASAIKDESDAATHDDLAVSQLARGLLENTGIPINPTIHQAVIAAIDARARERGEGFADAHDFIRDKVMKQKQLGQPDKWLFWFRDSKYEDQKLNGEDSISKSADGYEPRAPGDLPLTHQQRSVRAH